MTIQDIIQRLKEGNKRFVVDKLKGELQDSERRGQLTDEQKPYAIVLSCADSRVVPELAFDTGLGELFVCRVAGNIANTESIASIEYAVANLKPLHKVIVVLGHQSCGAVSAAVKGGDLGYNLNMLLAQITPAIAASGSSTSVNDIVKKNAELNAQELISRSAIISGALQRGEIAIIPAYYNLDSGRVDFLEQEA